VEAEMRRAQIPGLAYAVVQDGVVVHLRAFGIAGPDGRAMSTRTVMNTASLGGWARFVFSVPDLGVALLVLCIGLLAVGLVRLGRTLALRAPRTASPAMGGRWPAGHR
jgi:hypothetical protein